MADDIFGIVGTTQGAFKVERVVAAGGFGVVYRAYHGAFRAPVALKCLKIPESLPGEQRAQFLEKFREEAELLFRLSAAIPSVVRPLHHEVLSTKSGIFVPFIALEWLDGSTLAQRIAQRTTRALPPLPLEDVVLLLTPVARALEAAHRFPGPGGPTCVVHRDLKPSNIFLAAMHGSEVVKILDFGIASARDAASVMAGQSVTTTRGLATAFTPTYGSPEQWAPKRFGKTGPWTDVWGIALTCVETLAGRGIMTGDQMAIMGTVLDEKRRPTPLNEGVPVPEALELAFRRALAVDPRDRYQDVGAFWDEVETALGLPLSTPPIALPGRSSSPSRTSPEQRSRGPASGARPSQPGGVASPTALGTTVRAPDARAAPSGASWRSPARNLTPEPLESPISLDWSPGLGSKPSLVPLSPAALAAPLAKETTGGRTSTMELMSMFGLPVRLAGAGVLITVIDQAAASFLFNGERIGIGPFRLLWVAVALVLIGLAIAVFRLVASNR
jgi:eukaryotic-like serine/threonine-protein kinase